MNTQLDQDLNSPFFNWTKSELGPETLFPWEDIFRCEVIPLHNVFDSAPCEECLKGFLQSSRFRPESPVNEHLELVNKDLIAIEFEKPNDTGTMLGEQIKGVLTICLKHKLQVDFKPSIQS